VLSGVQVGLSVVEAGAGLYSVGMVKRSSCSPNQLRPVLSTVAFSADAFTVVIE